MSTWEDRRCRILEIDCDALHEVRCKRLDHWSKLKTTQKTTITNLLNLTLDADKRKGVGAGGGRCRGEVQQFAQRRVLQSMCAACASGSAGRPSQ